MLEDVLSWILANKEWLFSGLGIAIATLIVGFFRRRRNGEPAIKQKTRGNQSPAINAGGGVNIRYGSGDTDGGDD